MENILIQANSVKRSFRSPKKDEGTKGLLKLLFNPEYQDQEALKGVSCSIQSGEFVGLIGANGAGKTTFLKILSGLIPASSGSATVLGMNPFERSLEFRKSISLVMGQKAQLWWDLPATDAFDLLKAIYEIPAPLYKERLEYLANLLDVTRHLKTQIRRLSLGERMKMELIGALLHWPKIIFLDEPTIGLDVFAAQKLREFLKEFNKKEKATIILTSHNMDDIEQLCPRVILIRSGEFIYDGPPEKLKNNSGEKRLRVRLKQSPTVSELSKCTELSENLILIQESEDAEDSPPSLYFQIKAEQMLSVLQKLMASYQILDMGFEEESLEQVIGRIFSENHAEDSAKAKALQLGAKV